MAICRDLLLHMQGNSVFRNPMWRCLVGRCGAGMKRDVFVIVRFEVWGAMGQC